MKLLGVFLSVIAVMLFLSGCIQQSVIPPPTQIFHPPAWIHGTWANEGNVFWYEFTATTVIQGVYASSEDTTPEITVDLGELYRLSNTSVDETIAASYYSFTALLDRTEGVFQTMEFRKTTDLSISMTLITNTATMGPIVLYRQ